MDLCFLFLYGKDCRTSIIIVKSVSNGAGVLGN